MNPDVPHRFELELELPGTPEQVWHAIATADGLTAWMLPTTLEPREGGEITFTMGPDERSVGRVTAYEPPTRIAYDEDWASMAGEDPAQVTPLATEFVVEARSGGTCTVRVVTSAYGTGADWEHEFWGQMLEGWAPMLENLVSYVRHFAGQRAHVLEVSVPAPGGVEPAVAAVRGALAERVTGELERDHGSRGFVLRTTAPWAGLLTIFGWSPADGEGGIHLKLAAFGEGADGVATDADAWSAWLADVVGRPAPVGA